MVSNIPARVHRSKRFFQFLDGIPAEASSPDSDRIQPDQRITLGHQRERRDVAGDSRAAADHGALADSTVLMDDASSAQERVRSDLNVTAEQRAVGDDDTVSDRAVVPDVTADHQQATVTELGAHVATRTAMHGDVFAQHRTRTDTHERADARVELLVLRIVSDDRERVHRDTRAEDASRLDDRVSVDDATLAEYSAVFDDCGRVNRNVSRA